MLLAIIDILLRDIPDKRVRGIAVRQQRDDGEKDLGDGERRAPVVLENVQTDGSL